MSELSNRQLILEDHYVIELQSPRWSPTRHGDPGFVGNRLFPVSSLLFTADWLLLIGAFVGTSLVRSGSRWAQVWETTLPGWSFIIPFYVTAVCVVGWLAGAYQIRPVGGWGLDWRRAISMSGALFVTSLALLFVFDRDDVSRLFLVIYFPTVVLGRVAIRAGVRLYFRRRRASGRGVVNVLVIGSGPVAEGFTAEATAHTEAGVNVIGFLDAPGASLLNYPRLGTMADLPIVLEHLVVDEVVVCLPTESWGRIASIAHVAEQQGKVVRIPIQLPGSTSSRRRLDHLAGVPVLSLVSAPDQRASTAVKRAIDLLVSALAQLVLAPLMALVALSILIYQGRPILFTQARVGLHGRTFRLWKFRTMVPDAESRLDELADRNEREGPAFKISRDPRVTPLGRLLRRTSLDELPQLWNVLLGNMSLVGPRPPVPGEVERYDPWHRRRLSMKPGITGLWQVSNRSDKRFDSWVARDLEYIDTWSLSKDLRILIRTIPAVLKMTGE